MSATPKQVREIMKRIYYYQDKLQDALNDAHNKKIIDYPEEDGSYRKYSPCSPAWESRIRVDLTTEKALAKAIRSEIIKSIKR